MDSTEQFFCFLGTKNERFQKCSPMVCAQSMKGKEIVHGEGTGGTDDREGD